MVLNETEQQWTKDARIYEYGAAANPGKKCAETKRRLVVLMRAVWMAAGCFWCTSGLPCSRLQPLAEQDLQLSLFLWSSVTALYVDVKPIPVVVHPPELHEQGATRIIPFDISRHMDIEGEATCPNLMASFVRVNVGESIPTSANATSQAFYVIRGEGTTSGEHGDIRWGTGDMFVVPVTRGEMTHTCTDADLGGAALYWIHDQPLLDYLGVMPSG